MSVIPLPPGVRGLLFDLDGTLADTMPIHLAAWHAAGERFGVNITHEMITTHTGMPTLRVTELLNQLYGWTLVPTEVKAAKEEAYARLKPHIGVKPIAPVYALAQAYRGQLPMAVGTGSSNGSAYDTLDTLGIRDWFDAVVTADDVTSHKPEPETYLRCAELLGIPPADCVVFEDGDYGLQAGRAAGMHVIDVRPYVG
jgi:beta-phosphoglucomutase family hydrolase